MARNPEVRGGRYTALHPKSSGRFGERVFCEPPNFEAWPVPHSVSGPCEGAQASACHPGGQLPAGSLHRPTSPNWTGLCSQLGG